MEFTSEEMVTLACVTCFTPNPDRKDLIGRVESIDYYLLRHWGVDGPSLTVKMETLTEAEQRNLSVRVYTLINGDPEHYLLLASLWREWMRLVEKLDYLRDNRNKFTFEMGVKRLRAKTATEIQHVKDRLMRHK